MKNISRLKIGKELKPILLGLSSIFILGIFQVTFADGKSSVLNALSTSSIKGSMVKNNLISSEDPVKIAYIEPLFAADFSDDHILVGASQNIFVGTVLEQTGNKERGIGPETQYSVQIIKNIKGTLEGTVTVNQQGGYKDVTLYIVGDDGESRDNGDSYLLKPGSTYIFATRYNKSEKWYTLNSYPTASKLLTSAILETPGLLVLVANDSRVKELEAAYPNEILLKADIANNNTLNSYASLHTQDSATSTVQEESTEPVAEYKAVPAHEQASSTETNDTNTASSSEVSTDNII